MGKKIDDINVIVNYEPVIKPGKSRLSEEEILEKTKIQLEFLRLIFPFLDNMPHRKNYQGRSEQLFIELRTLKRFNPELAKPKKDKSTGELKQPAKGTSGYSSFNSFTLNPRTKKYLSNYIRTCNRAKSEICEYFVFAAFDKAIYSKNDTEMPKRPVMCKAANTAVTQVLLLDFDKIATKEFVRYYERIRNLGLECQVIFTGNGYQVHFLLDKPTRDIHALKAFIHLAIKMGYPVDKSANTLSQLARMPESNNSKYHDPKYGHEPCVIETKWLIKTTCRYDINQLFLTLSENQCNYDDSWRFVDKSKPAPVMTSDEDFKKSESERMQRENLEKLKAKQDEKIRKIQKKEERQLEKQKKAEKRAEKLEKSANKRSRNDMEVSFVTLNLKKIYPTIHLDHHSVGVQNLLKGPIEGLANLGLKFLVAYLKSLDYKIAEIIEITRVWQSLDTFDYAWNDEKFVESETERFFKSHYKIAKGDVPSLEDSYGELFNEDSSYYSLKDKVIFDNDNFCKLREITPTAFLLLCSIKANDLRKNTKYYTEADLSELVLKTEKTVRTHMDKLVALGIAKVEKRQSNDIKGGRPKKYYSLTDIDIEEIKYTKVDVSKIEALLFRTYKSKRVKEPLSDRAFMVALYVRYRAFGNRKSCFMKQENMAQEMGIGRTQLTNAMTELEKHNLIKKKRHDVFSTLEYVIMY